jgi:hypothetical protein
VPPRGLEPLQSGLKVRCPASRARAAQAGQLAASESNRAIPVHQTGPVDQLGRGQRNAAVSSLRGLAAAHELSGLVPAPAGCIPERKAEALIPSDFSPSRVRAGARPSGFTFHGGWRRS